MKNHVVKMMALVFFTALVVSLSGCGGSSSSPPNSTTGKVSLDVTDAPALEYAHVYVTVTGVAFHTSSAAGFDSYSTVKNSGWHRTDLSAPQTIDLAQLANGVMYGDSNGGSSLFSGLDLPAGRYQQIRIFLASSEDGLTDSAAALNLIYNNEVVLNGDSTHYPLRIPTADEGIRLIPETPVVVTAGSSANIVLDFNLNNDVVPVSPNGTKEFILKPRLGYFDMASVGAVKGVVNFGNLSTSRFVIKAEQVKNGANYRIVRRWTGVDKSTGKFNLYPLPVFGNTTTATYDILLRGRSAQTAIVKSVKIHKGTTLANGAVDLGTITMQPGTEFSAQLGSALHPTGAWVNFYQTIANDTVPYEIRYRHLDPYTGKFSSPEELSTGPIQVATYTSGDPLTFSPDTTSQGVFSVVADASGYYGRGSVITGVTGAVGQAVSLNFSSANVPQITGGASSDSISTIFNMSMFGTGKGHGMGMGPLSQLKPNSGQLFVTHGGMIVDSMGTLTGDTTIGISMHNGGGLNNAITVDNIPGNVPGAFYGVYGLGWGNGVLAAGNTRVDLSSGSATAKIKMK